MANNAIALQIRAPRGVDMGSVIQQNAMAINQVAQQQAAQRQAAKDQQAMELARTKETREGNKADIELARDRLAYHRDLASVVRSKSGYLNWLANVDKDSQEIADMFRANLPPEEFDRNPGAGLAALTQMIGTAEQNFNARYPKAISTAGQTSEGDWMSITTSGIPGASHADRVPDTSRPLGRMQAPATTAPPPRAELPPIDPAAAVAGAAQPDRAAILRNFGQPLPAENMRANGLEPMSYSPENQQPDLGKIVQTMMDTGVVSQSDVDAMRQAAGPGKDAQLAELLRANNIRIMPNEGMPGARNAVYNPDEGAASMQEAQYDPSMYETARGKPPMQSPMPGSAQVPLPRVRGEAEAGEAGKQGVRVATEPKIAAGTERAKRLEEMRGQQPIALNDVQTVVSDLASRIKNIDELLRHPYRFSIVGPIEGNLPGALQFGERADVQGLFDNIKNNTVLQRLLEARAQTKTGGSPLGNVSDADVRLIMGAALPIKQTGTDENFDARLKDLRNSYYQTMQRALSNYNNTFKEIAAERPDLILRQPDIAPQYKQSHTPKTNRTLRGTQYINW